LKLINGDFACKKLVFFVIVNLEAFCFTEACIIVIKEHPDEVLRFFDVGRKPSFDFNINSCIVQQINASFNIAVSSLETFCFFGINEELFEENTVGAQLSFDSITNIRPLFSGQKISNVSAMGCEVDTESLMVSVGFYLSVFEDEYLFFRLVFGRSDLKTDGLLVLNQRVHFLIISRMNQLSQIYQILEVSFIKRVIL
jgi:hypothetical protein